MARFVEDLVRRLRETQTERQRLSRAKDYPGATRMLDVAASLVDTVPAERLREALLYVTNPANAAPIPVALGPQDTAPAVYRDELHALIEAACQAAQAYGNSGGRDKALEAAYGRAYHELRAAIDRLPVVEMDGGRTS